MGQSFLGMALANVADCVFFFAWRPGLSHELLLAVVDKSSIAGIILLQNSGLEVNNECCNVWRHVCLWVFEN